MPTGILNNNSDERFNQYAFRQKADVRYELDLDSTSFLTVEVEGMLSNSRSVNDFKSVSSDGADQLLNQSQRRTSNEGDSKNFTINALWNKKLRKEGRTFSIGMSQNLGSSDITGFLVSENEFFGKDSTLDSTQIIDQQKKNNRERSVFRSNLAYTEPLSESLKFAVNYRFTVQNSISRLLSYEQSGSQQYNDLDSLFSNDFKLNQFSNELGATFNFEKGTHSLSASLTAADVNFKQIDRFQDDVLERSFWNLNPSARWAFQISRQKAFHLDYSGITEQPSISQIQPLRSNDDPLNIAIGNPDLNPSFRHNLNMRYNASKSLSGQFFSVSLNSFAISNAIISNVKTDEVGKSIYYYENLKGRKPVNLSSEVYYGRGIKGFNVGGRLGHRINQQYNVINDALNEITSHSTSLDLTFSRNEQGKYNFIFEGGPMYNSDVSSLQGTSSSKGWGFDGFLGLTLYLPGKFEVKSNNSYEYSEATQVFAQDFHRLLMNFSLNKKFLKTEELVLGISANDILNQNTGFSRRAYNTGFTQTDYTTIRRYFMVTVKWDFSRMGDHAK